MDLSRIRRAPAALRRPISILIVPPVLAFGVNAAKRNGTVMENANGPTGGKSTKYFVNGEEETTQHDKLKVREILEAAGLTPASDYELISENPPRKYGDPEQEIDIHPNQRFQARFKGPTPTSGPR